MDFSLTIYRKLLSALQQQGFSFQTFSDFIEKPGGKKVIVLRHDVDRLPGNSLRFAKIQAEKGIKGTYYFRAVPQSFNENIIKEIYSLGHEIGYHYEDVSQVAERQKTKDKRQKSRNNLILDLHDLHDLQDNGRLEKELADIAIESFSKNLQRLRDLAPVKTICMHGSPMSKWDSRVLWKYYDYRDFGIIGEPYFDINFDEVMYLTDTGRRWDGDAFNLRDKAIRQKDLETKGRRDEETERRRDGETKRRRDEETKRRRDEETKRRRDTGTKRLRDNGYGNKSLSPSILHLHSTFDIIRAAEEGRMPDKIMMTFHPQRWIDKPLPWVKELVWQNVKNVGKYFLNKSKKD